MQSPNDFTKISQHSIHFGVTGTPVGLKAGLGCLIPIAEAYVSNIPWDSPLVLYIANLLMFSIVGW